MKNDPMYYHRLTIYCWKRAHYASSPAACDWWLDKYDLAYGMFDALCR